MSEHLTAVRAFIVERNPALPELGLDDDLIDSRAIDSLAFVDFVFLLEELRGEMIDPEDIDVDDFRTLRRISERFLEPAVAR